MTRADRWVVWLAGAALASIGCGAKATTPPAPTATTLDATPAGPTHEALDVPVVLACLGPEFSGNAAPDIVWTGTELLVTRAINGELYLSRIGRDGVLRSSEPVRLDRPVRFDDQRWRLPGRWAAGRFRSVLVGRDPSSILVAEGAVQGPWNVALVSPSGSETAYLTASEGAVMADGVALIRLTPTDNEYVFRNALEIARPHGSVVLDPGCDRIDQVVATQWGLALLCDNQTPWAENIPSEGRDYQRTIVGIKDDRVAWRFDGTDPALWEVVIGTDGDNLLIVQASRTKADRERHPDQLRALRLDRDGRLIGQPFMTAGRLGEGPPYRMVWTGKEYALAEEDSFTRFDSEGHGLGTWFYEPDCGRDNADPMMVWMGDAYALCSWHHTVYQPDEAEYPAYCKEVRAFMPLYPALRVPPEAPTPSADP